MFNIDNQVLRIVKRIINIEIKKFNLKLIKILLFGSRARKESSDQSDWDFLIIINKDISFEEIKKISGNIQLRLAGYNIPNDIILRGINQFNNSKMSVGNISYYADKEGINI